MTDQEHADAIETARKTLNDAINAARNAGLEVQAAGGDDPVVKELSVIRNLQGRAE